jgi:hypothetical protein
VDSVADTAIYILVNVSINNCGEISKPRSRRRRRRRRKRSRHEVAGRVSHVERKQGSERRKIGKGKQNFKEGKTEKIVLPAEYQRTEQNERYAYIKVTEEREYITKKKKELKEHSSCVEHFHIISEDTSFPPLCLGLCWFEFIFSLSKFAGRRRNEVRVKMKCLLNLYLCLSIQFHFSCF